MTITAYAPTVPEGHAIIGIYFVVTAILGQILFERKEFNRLKWAIEPSSAG